MTMKDPGKKRPTPKQDANQTKMKPLKSALTGCRFAGGPFSVTMV